MPGLARRLAVVYGVLVLALPTGIARAAPSCAGPAGVDDPLVTAVGFLRRVVERKNVAGGYRLVTVAARHGISCRSWVHGRIPFQAYRHIDWNHATYRRVAAGTGQIVLRVTLMSTDGRLPREVFLLELREQGTRWQVGFWGRS